MLLFLQALGEQVDRHHRAGGVGEHRGDAGDAAHAPGEGTMAGEGQKLLAPMVEDDVESEQGEDEDSDDDASGTVVDPVE